MRTRKILLGLLLGTLATTGAFAQTVRVVGNRAYLPIDQYNPSLTGVRQVPTATGQMVTVDFTTPVSSTGSDYIYPVVAGAGVGGPGAATAAPAASEPDVGIMEAAGTLTNPTTFIYVSQDFVFSLLVLASRMGNPSVTFDPDLLPAPPPQTTRGGLVVEGGSGAAYTDEEYYGEEPGAYGAAGAAQQAPADVDKTGWLVAVSVTGHEEFEKLLSMVEELPEWDRVYRLPLDTSEKERIDSKIVEVYALAFGQIGPQTQARSAYYTGSSPWLYGGEEDYYSDDSYVAPSPIVAAQATPPVDPQAMAQWYYYYQQMIGWERYVADETLAFQPEENSSRYDLDTALSPQDLYLIPSPDGSPQVIHFDEIETEMTPYLSVIRLSALEAALDQMELVMKDWAEKRAKEDSDRSREYAVRLDQRQERRFRYRDWLNDQATEIRKMAEDYRRRLAGEHVQIEGMEILLTREKLSNVPFKARNIVTERLTPYDLLDGEGQIIRPAEEATDSLF